MTYLVYTACGDTPTPPDPDPKKPTVSFDGGVLPPEMVAAYLRELARKTRSRREEEALLLGWRPWLH